MSAKRKIDIDQDIDNDMSNVAFLSSACNLLSAQLQYQAVQTRDICQSIVDGNACRDTAVLMIIDIDAKLLTASNQREYQQC